METLELTDKQIVHELRLLFNRRKKETGITLELMACEIGVSIATLHNSIAGKFTSRRSLSLYRDYLKRLEQEAPR